MEGESTPSSLHGREHIAYLEAAPEGVPTADLLASPSASSARSRRSRCCGGTGAWTRTRSATSHWAPGDLTAVGPLHATHEPPFYLAGSDHWACGYMEGAVATGRGAARTVLGGDPIPLYPAR